MKNAVVLLVHLLAGLSLLVGTGGTRTVLAENILLKQQLLVLQRSRRRAPNLRPADRWLFGFCSQFLSPRRLIRTALILKPATLLRFHRAFKDFKYRCRGAIKTRRGCAVKTRKEVGIMTLLLLRLSPFSISRVLQRKIRLCRDAT